MVEQTLANWVKAKRAGSLKGATDETLSWLLWYHRTRMHSTLNYLSPIEFEQEWTEAKEKIAT